MLFRHVDVGDARADHHAVLQQRCQANVQHALVIGQAPADPLDLGGSWLARHRVEMTAQLDGPIGQLEILDRATVVVDPEPERPARGVVRHHQRPIRVEHHLRSPGEVERRLPQVLRDALRGAVARIDRHRSHSIVQRGLDHLAEHPPLEVHGCEEVAVGDQHLRLAQNQHAVAIEGKLEAPQNLPLCLGREVHERVSADE